MNQQERHLKRQIQRISDESREERVRIIIQVEPPDILAQYIEASATAIRRRNAVPSARDLVPPDRKRLQRGVGRAIAYPAAPPGLKAKGRAALQGVGMGAIDRLKKSSWVTDSVRGLPRGSGEQPVYFWSSSSAALSVSKKHLSNLPNEFPGLVGVFANRKIAQPPVSKAQGVPKAVASSKAYTWGLTRTGALASWGVFGAQGKGVRVAVLDTGIDAKHPDLAGKVAGFAEFDRKGRKVSDGLRHAYDSEQHGTHCAGTIVGGNASSRWIGMAPRARVLAGLVLKNGYATDAQILAGMQWAIEKKADIISMSLGGLSMSPDVLDTYTQTIITANWAGIPVVAAVGNDGSQTTGSPGNDYHAFTVGATDFEERAAGFSGGRTQIINESRYIDGRYLPLTYSKPDVSAPGVDVYSSVPNGRWQTWSGTSMATPHVAGAMALLMGMPGGMQQLSGLDRTDVVQLLLIGTVKEMGEAGQNHRFGHGRINVLRALGYARDLGYIDSVSG